MQTCIICISPQTASGAMATTRWINSHAACLRHQLRVCLPKILNTVHHWIGFRNIYTKPLFVLHKYRGFLIPVDFPLNILKPICLEPRHKWLNAFESLRAYKFSSWRFPLCLSPVVFNIDTPGNSNEMHPNYIIWFVVLALKNIPVVNWYWDGMGREQ